MLLDTSGLLCLVHVREPRHELAISFYESSKIRTTHSYVLGEFVALAHSRRISRTIALAFSDRLISDPEIEVEWVDERIHRAALKLLENRPDKTYSLCDAVSFILMRERGIEDALTTDKHFEQEGFRRLLAP